MSSIRPYWQRHPMQARALALVILLAGPFAIPAILMIVYRHEIFGAVVSNFRDTWKIVKSGVK